MQTIECKGRVALSSYVRQVSFSRIALRLLDALDKPIAGGTVNLSLVMLKKSGQDLIILPA